MSETVKSVMPKIGTYVDTKPFWDAARERRLVLQYCLDSGKFQHYPRPVSIYTGSRNLAWREVSGSGLVYACTIVRVPTPGYAGPVPCAVATVELAEGVRIVVRIVECEPDAVTIGMPVRLEWEELGEGNYPVFAPDRAAS